MTAAAECQFTSPDGLRYRDAGVLDLEMLNEVNRREVVQNLRCWISAVID